jgi:hypothetical protein
MRVAQAFVLIFLCTLAGHGSAHQDTDLQLSSDGRIHGLPHQYESTRLQIEFADKAAGRPTKMTFISAGKQTVIERCLLERLPVGSWRHMSLSGSWYHDNQSLPHYVVVRFETPAQSPDLPHPLGISFLLSLQNARLIVAEEALSTASKDEVKLSPIRLRAGCPSE